MSRAESRIRSKNWTFTYFPDENESLASTMNEWKQINVMTEGGFIAFICAGQEIAPSTNKRHFQGYIETFKIKSMTFMKNKLNDNKTHWEIAKGSRYQNIQYCSKEKDTDHGEYYEMDYLRYKEELLREDVKRERLRFFNDARNLSIKELEEYYPNTMFNSRGKVMEWRMFQDDKKIYNGELSIKNYWIYGPTGVGKSRWVRDQNMSLYEKNINKWWNGYDKQQIVVLEDFPIGDKGKIMFDFVKVWADRYPFIGECKNGHMRINPIDYYLIITANHSISETFEGLPKVDIDALRRRFKEVEIKSENDIFLNTRINN